MPWLLSGLLACVLANAGPQDLPDEAPFFEKRIRPILVERCYSCHSARAATVKGGFRLDSREGLLRGGSSGPAIFSGDPDRSLLIKAVRHGDEDFRMPPKTKLDAESIADLEAWVRRGAFYPSLDHPASGAPDPRNFWSFQPPRECSLPPVKDEAWPRSPVDFFILARLEKEGLAPGPPADPRTLLRRVTLDLTGLPPTPEETDAFLKDRSPDAFEKVVDRLLASPHYGERWGRHWLDVARYADTKGDVFGDEEPRYPFAWTYRDWVIRALNEDLPYDRFLLLQLAADRVVGSEGTAHLAAMGFLTVGRRFRNNVHDIIDDRIDVVMRGLQGLTMSCARCHDHKYDPLPAKDYYSLYGVFASSVEPKVYPLLPQSTKTPENLAYEKEVSQRKAAVDQAQLEIHGRVVGELHSGSSITAYLMATHEARKVIDSKERRIIAQRHQVNDFVLKRWMSWLDSRARRKDPLYATWFALSALLQEEFSRRSPEIVAGIADPGIREALAEPPGTLREVAEKVGLALAGHASLQTADAPAGFSLTDLDKVMGAKDTKRLRDLRRKLNEVEAVHPGAPPRAMALEDAPKPVEPYVFVRGNDANRGNAVPRQFPWVLCSEKRVPFREGSGRLDLARAIASEHNPLTARVIVNRVWMHHFGQGLVRTPGDFGTRGEPPTHPELLDTLAVRFMKGGWSLKKLHRELLLSTAYRQSSDNRGDGRLLDPDNKLLWRANRRRLDLEALRDSILAVSGRLDPRMGGPPVDLSGAPAALRRTVYGFIDRQNLPGLFRTFDFANPDATNPQRYVTTVPQQALFLMNNPFVAEQAGFLVRRPDVIAETEPSARIQMLNRILFGRAAEPSEVAAARRFLGDESSAWEPYVQALLLSNEFAFVD